MLICIEKSTGKIIEMQSDATQETLIQNALNAGYNLEEIEEKQITTEEYQAILVSQPLSIDEQIEEIEARYKLKFDRYKDLITTIIAADGANQTEKIASIQAEYAATSDQKELEILAVLGGAE